MERSRLISRTVFQAPMAGGPSTPELAAAVSGAGGVGFLAGGYQSVDRLRSEIRKARRLTDEPFGVNLFVPPTSGPLDRESLALYVGRLAGEADRLGAVLEVPTGGSDAEAGPGVPGAGDWREDGWHDKIEMLLSEGSDLVSFTFGCPPPSVVNALRETGATVLLTVTTAPEAAEAERAGADALCVQGTEAGGHQGSFLDPDTCRTVELGPLLQAVSAATSLPLVAAGGVNAEAAAVRALLDRGASAVSLGTAFLRTPESGADPAHKAALAHPRFTSTGMTRAFSGRWARGLVNRFVSEHSAVAPSGYPELNRLIAPLRHAAAGKGDWEAMALWAGTGFRCARAVPAAAITSSLLSELARVARG